MKFRRQRGSLAESMATLVEVTSRAELAQTLRRQTPELKFTDTELTFEPCGKDERIGWNTYLVCVRGAAVGFSDGQPEK